MCDILAEHNLSQCNKHPTRLSNILDLLCSTSPCLVKSILAYPGMSDHSVIVPEVNMKARLGKKTPRQIYIYGKGDMNAVKKDMDDLYQSSFSNIDGNEPVDYLWSICGVSSPKACSTQLKRTSHRKLHHGAGIYHISLQTSSGS